MSARIRKKARELTERVYQLMKPSQPGNMLELFKVLHDALMSEHPTVPLDNAVAARRRQGAATREAVRDTLTQFPHWSMADVGAHLELHPVSVSRIKRQLRAAGLLP